MLNNRDLASLLDIARAARKVRQYKAEMGKADFLSDDKTQSAIVFQLLIIGEAVKRLSSDLRFPTKPHPPPKIRHYRITPTLHPFHQEHAMISAQLIATLNKLSPALQAEVLHYAEYLTTRQSVPLSNIDQPTTQYRQAGSMKGMITLSHDFDAPLEDLKDYM